MAIGCELAHFCVDADAARMQQVGLMSTCQASLDAVVPEPAAGGELVRSGSSVIVELGEAKIAATCITDAGKVAGLVAETEVRCARMECADTDAAFPNAVLDAAGKEQALVSFVCEVAHKLRACSIRVVNAKSELALVQRNAASEPPAPAASFRVANASASVVVAVWEEEVAAMEAKALLCAMEKLGLPALNLVAALEQLAAGDGYAIGLALVAESCKVAGRSSRNPGVL